MWGDQLLLNSMLNDRDEVLTAARELREPVIVWDTRTGSSSSKFFLVDLDNHTRGPQITRELFNQMREDGALDTAPEARKKVDRFQAWPVRV